jgi:hypothetical protein
MISFALFQITGCWKKGLLQQCSSGGEIMYRAGSLCSDSKPLRVPYKFNYFGAGNAECGSTAFPHRVWESRDNKVRVQDAGLFALNETQIQATDCFARYKTGFHRLQERVGRIHGAEMRTRSTGTSFQKDQALIAKYVY